MRIIPLAILVICVVSGGYARAQGDEGRPAPSRGLLKRGLLAKGKATTTTTTTPAQKEEADYEYDSEDTGELEPQVSSTEAPSSTEGKKLVAGGIRPFRSNADLLEALKRRRAQVAEAKIHGSTTAAVPQEIQTEAPAKSSYSNKKRYNTATRETNNEDAPPPAKPSRGRFGGRPLGRSTYQEEQPEEVQEAPAPPARTGRTFNRRGN